MKPPRKQLRAQVHDRDHGICAECGLDCDRLKERYIGAELTDERNFYFVCPRCEGTSIESGKCPSCGHAQLTRRTSRDARSSVEQELADRGYSIAWIMRLRRSGARGVDFWQADHSEPIGEEGPDTIENLVTLCWPHHKAKTSGQANRRKHANKAAKRTERKRHSRDCRIRAQRMGRWGRCTCGATSTQDRESS